MYIQTIFDNIKQWLKSYTQFKLDKLDKVKLKLDCGGISCTKEEANKNANLFLKDIFALEKKYNMSLNSDTGDIYFSFKNELNRWDSVKIVWSDSGKTGTCTKTILSEIKTEPSQKCTCVAFCMQDECYTLGYKKNRYN